MDGPVSLMLLLLLHLAGLALLVASLLAYLGRSGFPLELLAHWRVHYLLAGLVLVGLAFPLNEALLFGLGFTTAFAAAGPLWLARRRCRGGQTPGEAAVTLLWCNVWQKRGPVEKLAELARRERADVVAMSEIPLDIADADLKALFPEHPHLARCQPDAAQKYDARMVVLSREPLSEFQIHTPEAAPRKPFATLRLPDRELFVALVHASTSVAPGLAKRRDASFELLTRTVMEEERWLAVGDFNAAPWTADFELAPGRRLGPCFRRTWKAFPPFYGLPLDHALASAEVAGEMRLGPWIGSDHRPLIVRAC